MKRAKRVFLERVLFGHLRDDGSLMPPLCQGQADAKRKLFDAPMSDLGSNSEVTAP
jgi:hypothetical protein